MACGCGKKKDARLAAAAEKAAAKAAAENK